MSDEAWSRFLQKLAESPEFRAEFAELALRHGIDFSAVSGELSENELGSVSGGASAGSDGGELANIDLQNALQKQQQLVQMLSNVSKLMSDTETAIVRKIG